MGRTGEWLQSETVSFGAIVTENFLRENGFVIEKAIPEFKRF
jgi:hypothetical protein